MLAACGGGGGGGAGPAGKRVGPAIDALLGAADKASAPWRCAAADLPAVADETIGAWHLGGHAMRSDAKGPIAIGVIGDAGGDAPATIAAIGRIRAKLKADLVIVLGGMGGTRAEIEAGLTALGNDMPIVVLPGDLEPVREHVAALASLKARGAKVVDGRLVRFIELPSATIGTLPGALAPERLVAGSEGCLLAPADATAVLADLAKRDGLRISASAEAPRHDETGDLAIGPATGQVDVQLYGAGDATPKRDGKRDGGAIPIGPGAIDATTRLDGPHAPSAGVITLRDGAWSWSPIVDSP